MKEILFVLIFLFAMWFILPFLNIDANYVIPRIIEWLTTYILPWIALYWGIRLVKGIEKN